MDLALNNLQKLKCHKNQPSNPSTNQPTNQADSWEPLQAPNTISITVTFIFHRFIISLARLRSSLIF